MSLTFFSPACPNTCPVTKLLIQNILGRTLHMHICFINLPPHSRLWKEHYLVYIHESFQEGGHNLEPVFAKTFFFQKYIFIQRLLQDNRTMLPNHRTDTPCAYTSVSFQWRDSTIETRNKINLTFLLETNHQLTPMRNRADRCANTIHSSCRNLVVENLIELRTSWVLLLTNGHPYVAVAKHFPCSWPLNSCQPPNMPTVPV